MLHADLSLDESEPRARERQARLLEILFCRAHVERDASTELEARARGLVSFLRNLDGARGKHQALLGGTRDAHGLPGVRGDREKPAKRSATTLPAPSNATDA